MTRPTRVAFLDLAHQIEPFQEQLAAVWLEILRSGQFVSGEHVERFESAFASAQGVRNAVAVSNGTAALELILRALDVGPGQSVVVPANSFIATAEAVSNVGATPIFADCLMNTSNIDPASAENVIRWDTVGIIGVHLYGAPCDVDALTTIANRHGLFLMEDAAQAHLATSNGRLVGGLGVAGAFSFYPGKNIGAPGEGGAVTTNDDNLAETVRLLRNHGQSEKYASLIVGTNARMGELAASTLHIKLPHLDEWTKRRREIAQMYAERLAGQSSVEVLEVPDGVLSAYHLYCVEVADRDQIRERLTESGIGTGLHYPTPIHLQRAYEHLGYQRGSLPVAERKAASVLSLPMHPDLSEANVDFVVATLLEGVA